MEITARELRDVEIREAFRGYHRDDVNDLLERAASTIDAANERLRQMSERLSTAQNDTGRSRETEDILHRTLLLAQRAADETVAEAQVKARQMVDDADTQARRTIAEAETEARVRGETERRRLEQEVIDMAARRDALKSDVEMLTRYEGEYRERLLRSLETDLETLRSRPQVAPGPAPETSDVDVPAASERMARREDAGPPTREIDMNALMKEEQAKTATASSTAGTPAMSNGGATNGGAPAQPKPMATPAPTGPSASANGQAAATGQAGQTGTMTARGQVATEERTIDIAGDNRTEEPKRAPAPIDLLAAEGAMDAEVLDDEAFFATLREAVHDEAPLGPREDDQSSLFDQDDTDAAAFKDVFRRNR
jgi:cell division initiation protein